MKTKCHRNHERSWMAHACDTFDGMRICVECREISLCGCFYGRPLYKRALHVAWHRLQAIRKKES